MDFLLYQEGPAHFHAQYSVKIHSKVRFRQYGLVVPGRAQKSSGSGLLISKSSGSGLFGFPTKSNLRVRVQAFGFIGFFGFKFAVFIAFL